MGELWPVIVGTFLFWHLANKITDITEAPRFYSLFKFFGQFNLLFSSWIGLYIVNTKINLSFLFTSDNAIARLQLLTLVIVVSGVFCLLLHYFIEHKIVLNEKYFNINKMKKPLKLSLMESWKMVVSSK